MAWGRVARLLIGTRLNSSEAVDLSLLDFEFSVTRTILFEPSTAGITIYNVSKETREMITTENVGVSLSAGYRDGAMAEIFAGAVEKSEFSVDGAVTRLDITATNSRPVGSALTRLTITMSFDAYAPITDVIRAIASRLGVMVHGLENVSDIRLENGWSYSGSVSGAFRYLRNVISANGRGFYTDLNTIVCYRVGQPSGYTIVTVSHTSGLLSVKREVDTLDSRPEKSQIKGSRKKVQDPKEKAKITITTLLIPQLQPNGLIRVDRDELGGIYHIEKITYIGSTFADDWTCEVEAAENV